jgi:hypothetical protein
MSLRTLSAIKQWSVVRKLQGYLSSSNPVLIFTGVILARSLLTLYLLSLITQTKSFSDKSEDTIKSIFTEKAVLLPLLELACGAKRGVVKTEGYEAKVESEEKEGEAKPEEKEDEPIGILAVKKNTEDASTGPINGQQKSQKDFRVQWEAGRVIARLAESPAAGNPLYMEPLLIIATRALLTLAVSPFDILCDEASSALATLLRSSPDFAFLPKDFKEEELKYVEETFCSKKTNEQIVFIQERLKISK